MPQYRDPPRLADGAAGASPKVLRAVMAGRTDLPDREQVAGLARRLAALMPAAGGVQPSGLEGAPSASGASMASGASSLAAGKIKLATLLVAAGVGSAGAWHVLTKPESNRGEPATTPRAAPAATAQRQEAKQENSPAGQGVAPEPDAVEVEPVRPFHARPSAEPRREQVGSAKPSALKTGEADDSGSEELRLLESAHRVIIQSPRNALELARLHEKRFANGVFGQEREVIIIEALLRMGQYREARSHAEQFFERFPASSHLPRVRALLKSDAR